MGTHNVLQVELIGTVDSCTKIMSAVGKNWVPVTVMGRTDEHWVEGGHLCDCSDGKLKNWGLIGRGGENWNFCRG